MMYRERPGSLCRVAIVPLLLAMALVCPGALAQLGGLMGRAEPESFAFTDCRIVTMGGRVFEDGTIVVQNGRIARMGDDVEVPKNARRFSLKGGTVTPGLIDVWSGLGLDPGGPASSNPLHRAVDVFDPFAEDGFKDALANGVTVVCIDPPGRGSLLGVGATVRLVRDGEAWGEVVNEDGWLTIDMTSDRSPAQRLATLDQLRKQFRAALDYREAADVYEEELEEYIEKLEERAKKEEEEKEKEEGEGDDADKPKGAASMEAPRQRGRRGGGGGEEKEEEIKKPREPQPNRQIDFLLEVLDGEVPVRVRAERDADILNAIELAEEFDLDVTLLGGAEAHLVADEIADAGFPVVLGSMVRGGLYSGDEYARLDPARAGVLRDAGVEVYFGGGGSTAPSRFVLASAQLAAQYADGIDALGAVTVDAARFLGLPAHGRLFRGGPADFVVWSGDPRSEAARVEKVFLAGKPAYAAPRRTGDE